MNDAEAIKGEVERERGKARNHPSPSVSATSQPFPHDDTPQRLLVRLPIAHVIHSLFSSPLSSARRSHWSHPQPWRLSIYVPFRFGQVSCCRRLCDTPGAVPLAILTAKRRNKRYTPQASRHTRRRGGERSRRKKSSAFAALDVRASVCFSASSPLAYSADASTGVGVAPQGQQGS